MKLRHSLFKANILLLVISIAIAFFIGEVGLRAWDAYNVHAGKKPALQYRSAYGNWAFNLFELRPANTTIVEKKEEFAHTISTNSLGLNDREWNLHKDSALRIACMGDSYTEGFGATADSSYPEILQSILTSTEVMRCGMQACDPLQEYYVLKKGVISYKPNIVTVTVNSTDVDDVITKGGFERFSADGMVKWKSGPWWEPFVKCSYVVRLICLNALKMDYLLMNQQQHAIASKNAMQTLCVCLDMFHTLCAQNGMRCIFVFNPGCHEVRRGKLDCLPVLNYAKSVGYETIDGLSYFYSQGVTPDNWTQYYWEKDGHNNNEGYRLMAQMLCEYIAGHTCK